MGAVIAAAGQGLRMGMIGDGPQEKKQYVTLEGVPVLLRALEAFESVPAVDEIVVVVPEDDVNWVEAEWLAPRRGRQRLHVVAGGASRQESVARGCAALSPECRWVIVHDGARPLVTRDVIERVLEGARSTGAAVCGLPVTDTIKRVDGAGHVVETLPGTHCGRFRRPRRFAGTFWSGPTGRRTCWPPSPTMPRWWSGWAFPLRWWRAIPPTLS